jgi:membrane peptidoglycan carboxypeptidase
VLALLALPGLHVVSLAVDVSELPPLADRSVLVAADGSTLAVLHDGQEREVVPLERIPPHAREAFIAAEDRRFPDHPGYDVAAMGRALLANLRAGKVVEGASTITQQLAKLNFTGDDPTVARKARELVYAIALDRAYPKDALLERYLNQVYFGAGAYGIAVASWEYFRVPPEELAPEQAAVLAAMVRSPGRFDPRARPPPGSVRSTRVPHPHRGAGVSSENASVSLLAQPEFSCCVPRER